MMFIVSRRRPASVPHFSCGRLITPGTWPFLKSLDSRTSIMTTSSPFSIWWLISTGPVVKAILSAKNCFALAALLLNVLVITRPPLNSDTDYNAVRPKRLPRTDISAFRAAEAARDPDDKADQQNQAEPAAADDETTKVKSAAAEQEK